MLDKTMTALDYFSGRRRETAPGNDNRTTTAGPEHILQLIRRYPHISGVEASEILRHIRTARYAEIARLTSDEAVRSKLDHLIANHKHEFEWSAVDWIAPIALAVGLLAIVWMLWSLTA